MAEIILPTPPIVLQQHRHICWAAAYESWAQAQGIQSSLASANRIVDLLHQIGRGYDRGRSGLVLDDQERILPSGLATFAQLVGMDIQLVNPEHLTAVFLERQLRRSYIWLWGTPNNGGVAHIVVIYGINNQGLAFYMDPLVGLVRVRLRDMVHRMRIFAVGTLLISRVENNPFAGLSSSEVHLPPERGLLFPF